MKPKHLSLFYFGLVIGLAGAWMFAFTLYWIIAWPSADANIGAGLLGIGSWIMGIISFLLLLFSFVLRPHKKQGR